jgi:2-oxoglutarate ferredoxin oxidoreductase subunit delta
MAKGHIIIDERRCKGCTLCTSVCPQDVIVMADEVLNAKGYHPARYDDPQGKCTGCTLCAVICPDVCITVYRQKRFPQPRLQHTPVTV